MATAVAAVTAFATAAAPYVSAAFSAYSFVQQRNAGKKAKTAESNRVSLVNQKNEQQRRIAAANLKRKKLMAQQEYRIKTSDMLTKGMRSGVVQSGSSGLSNALGGLFTDSANYQNYLTGVTEAGDTMSQTQSGINTATSNVNTAITNQKGWQAAGDAVNNAANQISGGTFSNPFKAFDTPATPTSSQTYPNYNVGK
tara:strand:+ start:589 stop:1179 length:591 start_codon:yes stop_codon:yes gene_type:complete